MKIRDWRTRCNSKSIVTFLDFYFPTKTRFNLQNPSNFEKRNDQYRFSSFRLLRNEMKRDEKEKKRKKEKEEKNSTTQQVEDARGSVGGRGNSKFRNKMYPIARGSRVEAATIGIISIGWADFRLILVSRAPTYCNHADILCSCNARSPSPLHPPPCTSASTYSTLRLPINALLRRR